MGRWRQREEQAGQAGTDVEGSLAPHLHPPEHPHILHPHTHQFIHLPMAKLLSPHHPPSTAPRSRAAPAPRRPETASDHVSKEEESDKNHSGDEDEDDNEGDEDDEVSPFTGLVAKLAASKWRLDAVKLRTTFPKSALHSRDFMRQLVAWAEHGEYTFDLMLQAIDETRRNIHQSSDPRRRVPKEDQWRPQYFRHTLERLHAQGKELRVPHRVQKAQQPPPSSPQAQLPVLPSARSGQKRSHSMTQMVTWMTFCANESTNMTANKLRTPCLWPQPSLSRTRLHPQPFLPQIRLHPRPWLSQIRAHQCLLTLSRVR